MISSLRPFWATNRKIFLNPLPPIFTSIPFQHPVIFYQLVLTLIQNEEFFHFLKIFGNCEQLFPIILFVFFPSFCRQIESSKWKCGPNLPSPIGGRKYIEFRAWAPRGQNWAPGRIYFHFANLYAWEGVAWAIGLAYAIRQNECELQTNFSEIFFSLSPFPRAESNLKGAVTTPIYTSERLKMFFARCDVWCDDGILMEGITSYENSIHIRKIFMIRTNIRRIGGGWVGRPASGYDKNDIW